MDNIRRFSQIGIDRLVRLRWLEKTANLLLVGSKGPEVKAVLAADLGEVFTSADAKARGSLDKTLTVLMKIWVRPPRSIRPLQQRGLELLVDITREERVALHWGMTMAAYPFWGAVAAHVGRLLRLQEVAIAGQVQRRVREQYGERETVSRRVRYVLRSFVDWGVLRETPARGTYVAGPTVAIERIELTAWLVEAFLWAHPNGSADLGSILGAPSLFPFRLGPVSAVQLASASKHIDVLRHGLSDELIMLRDNFA